MRTLDLFITNSRDPELARSMDFGSDVERGQERDAHSHDNHLAQGVEARAFVIAKHVCAQAVTESLDLLVEMMVILEGKYGFTCEISALDPALLG